MHIPALLAHPDFRIELPLTREEEIRGPIVAGARYRHPRTWRRVDRRLLEIIETRRLDTPGDLLSLLPSDLPEPFTTADIVAQSGRSKRLARRAAYCLERCGATVRLPRRGRFVAYERLPVSATVSGPGRGRPPRRQAVADAASPSQGNGSARPRISPGRPTR